MPETKSLPEWLAATKARGVAIRQMLTMGVDLEIIAADYEALLELCKAQREALEFARPRELYIDEFCTAKDCAKRLWEGPE